MTLCAEDDRLERDDAGRLVSVWEDGVEYHVDRHTGERIPCTYRGRPGRR